MPVVILTARDAVRRPHRAASMRGADDYLVKPFDLEELAARIRAVAAAAGTGRAQPLMLHGELTLNPATHQVRIAGDSVRLSSREFRLLQALLERPGAVLSRTQLEERLYGWHEEVESNAVEVHIHHLRKKLGAWRHPQRAGRRLHGGEGSHEVDPQTPAVVADVRAGAGARPWPGLTSYVVARGNVRDLFDYQLRQMALTLQHHGTSGQRAAGRGARR